MQSTFENISALQSHFVHLNGPFWERVVDEILSTAETQRAHEHPQPRHTVRLRNTKKNYLIWAKETLCMGKIDLLTLAYLPTANGLGNGLPEDAHVIHGAGAHELEQTVHILHLVLDGRSGERPAET